MFPDKILKENKFLNYILKKTTKELILIFIYVFDISLRLRYCPRHFKKSVIVILRKSDKSNYLQQKLYKFITLMNIISKMINIVLTKRI
ncbi:hypothetical protein F5884DRAFT_1054 [Xylogone sp. PMI_703]|nr:hypothetical protein F5884DRAFT_1054 [Xylogone sp. PMI_703]